jgi:hypothetical protein
MIKKGGACAHFQLCLQCRRLKTIGMVDAGRIFDESRAEFQITEHRGGFDGGMKPPIFYKKLFATI